MNKQRQVHFMGVVAYFARIANLFAGKRTNFRPNAQSICVRELRCLAQSASFALFVYFALLIPSSILAGRKRHDYR